MTARLAASRLSVPDPTAPEHAANKHYVDTTVAGGGGGDPVPAVLAAVDDTTTDLRRTLDQLYAAPAIDDDLLLISSNGVLLRRHADGTLERTPLVSGAVVVNAAAYDPATDRLYAVVTDVGTHVSTAGSTSLDDTILLDPVSGDRDVSGADWIAFMPGDLIYPLLIAKGDTLHHVTNSGQLQIAEFDAPITEFACTQLPAALLNPEAPGSIFAALVLLGHETVHLVYSADGDAWYTIPFATSTTELGVPDQFTALTSDTLGNPLVLLATGQVINAITRDVYANTWHETRIAARDANQAVYAASTDRDTIQQYGPTTGRVINRDLLVEPKFLFVRTGSP